MTLKMLEYWEKLRGTRTMPLETDVDPEMVAEVWEHCFVVQVRDVHKKDYNYSYLGGAIVDAYRAGKELVDQTELAGLTACKLANNYHDIVHNKRPLLQEGQLQNLLGDLIKYRQCLMPLGTDDKVHAILGVMRFKFELPAAPAPAYN